MSEFYGVGWILNLYNKRVTSNVFSLFHSTGSNVWRIEVLRIFFSILCAFYILDRKIENLKFYRLAFSDDPKY